MTSTVNWHCAVFPEGSTKTYVTVVLPVKNVDPLVCDCDWIFTVPELSVATNSGQVTWD